MTRELIPPGMMRVTFDSLESVCIDAADAVAYAGRAVNEVKVAIGQNTVAVRFSRPSAAAVFAERFGDMAGHGEPVVVAYAVDLDGEAYFWVSPDTARRWPHQIADELLVFFVDNLVSNAYLTATSDLGLHAAVIARERVAVALVGISTAGKTTTAIAAVARNFTFYSDERCIVQDGVVVPFLRALTVRDGGRELLLREAGLDASIEQCLRAMPPGSESVIRPSTFFGKRAGGPPAILRAVFLIDGHADAPTVERSSSHAALPALLRSMASRDTGLGRAARLSDVLRDVGIYRLRLGSPSATIAAIESALLET